MSRRRGGNEAKRRYRVTHGWWYGLRDYAERAAWEAALRAGLVRCAWCGRAFEPGQRFGAGWVLVGPDLCGSTRDQDHLVRWCRPCGKAAFGAVLRRPERQAGRLGVVELPTYLWREVVCGPPGFVAPGSTQTP